MRSRRSPVPAREFLVRYEAAAMPTPVLERLFAENRSDPQVLGLLLRIALQKIEALEEAR